LAHFKATNTRRALLFCACVGMSLVNNTPARFFSRGEVGGPAQRLQASGREPGSESTGAHPTATSAGECLVASTVCGPVWRQAQLADAIS
jgi:hypothetical protein